MSENERRQSLNRKWVSKMSVLWFKIALLHVNCKIDIL